MSDAPQPPRPAPKLPKVAFVWDQFGPYHVDRCTNAARTLAGRAHVTGCQIASSSQVYAWAPTTGEQTFDFRTLYPGRDFEQTRWPARLLRLFRTLAGSRWVFLAGYERPDIFFLAILLRLTGSRVFVMLASKFEDKPRFLWFETFKSLLMLPYNGAIVGGPLQKQYVDFLSLKQKPVVTGYNTVDLDRVRETADQPPAPDGPAFADRHFVIVTRFVQKKNLPMIIDAFARYRALAGADARRLQLVGDGPLMNELRALAERLGVMPHIDWTGFIQAPEVAKVLSKSLALLLPSTEEQWGLVVNEALAFNLPIMVSDKVGARSALISWAVNGYVLETDNPDAWAAFMHALSKDEAWWRRMVEGSRRIAPRAHTPRFGEGVLKLIGLPAHG